jgi:hypothetical protein
MVGAQLPNIILNFMLENDYSIIAVTAMRNTRQVIIMIHYNMQIITNKAIAGLLIYHVYIMINGFNATSSLYQHYKSSLIV